MSDFTFKRREREHSDHPAFDVYLGAVLLGRLERYTSYPTRKIAGSRLVRNLKPRNAWRAHPAQGEGEGFQRSEGPFSSKRDGAEWLEREHEGKAWRAAREMQGI